VAVEAALDLVSPSLKIRSSQINGCANCLNMHTAEARAMGETEQRIYLLSAWREAPCYTDRERAALAWTEALTQLSEGHRQETAYPVLEAHFTEREQVELTLMINIIRRARLALHELEGRGKEIELGSNGPVPFVGSNDMTSEH
jgi:AhpD family alkylhydroperoxidase